MSQTRDIINDKPYINSGHLFTMGLGDLIQETLAMIVEGGDVECLGEYLAAVYVRLDLAAVRGDFG